MSIFPNLYAWPPDQEQQKKYLEKLRQMTTADLQWLRLLQYRKLYSLRDRFPEAEADPHHPKADRIQRRKYFIRCIDHVIEERRTGAPPGPLPAFPAAWSITPAGRASPKAVESRAKRAERRQSVLKPILAHLGWRAYRLEEEAGVTSKVAYRYLNGTTGRIGAENQNKIEAAIRRGLKQKPSGPPFRKLPE